MIVHPKNWETIGQPIQISDLEKTIEEVLYGIQCNCLALSGGLDSSLMLYFMLKVYREVTAFTIGSSENHRDVKYAKLVMETLGGTKHLIYIPSKKEINEEKDQPGDFKGDKATRLFYKFVKKHTHEIISCDGVDEFMCGYYAHQVPRTELAYFEFIRRMRLEHLKPLHHNSKGVNIYLPYLDARLLYLMYQIPTYEKVNGEDRKILMLEMAKDKIPYEITIRRKIGFCDVLGVQGDSL